MRGSRTATTPLSDLERDRLADAYLVDREAGVLRLAAENLSNAEIAARFYVTVGASLLTKPRVRDRTQAVIAADESASKPR